SPIPRACRSSTPTPCGPSRRNSSPRFARRAQKRPSSSSATATSCSTPPSRTSSTGPSRSGIPGGGRSVEGKADLQGHLPVGDLALGDLAARVDHLEPAQVVERARRLRHGVEDRLLHPLG